jgi:hypothetical protein
MVFSVDESWTPAAGPGEVWADPDWQAMVIDIRRILRKKEVDLIFFLASCPSTEAQKASCNDHPNGFMPPEARWAKATVPRIFGFRMRMWSAARYNTRRGRFPSTKGDQCFWPGSARSDKSAETR